MKKGSRIPRTLLSSDKEGKMEREPIREMKELSEQLLQASRAYYQEDREIMSNREYDALYDRLLEL